MSLRLVRPVVYRANVTLSVIRESRAEEPTGTWAAASEILVVHSWLDCKFFGRGVRCALGVEMPLLVGSKRRALDMDWLWIYGVVLRCLHTILNG